MRRTVALGPAAVAVLGLLASGCTSESANTPPAPSPKPTTAHNATLATPLTSLKAPDATLDDVTSCQVRDASIIIANDGKSAVHLDSAEVQLAHNNSSSLTAKSYSVARLEGLSYPGEVDRTFNGTLMGGRTPVAASGATLLPASSTSAGTYYLLVADLQITDGTDGPLNVLGVDIDYTANGTTHTLQVNQALTINAGTCKP